jgi:hypothetical protein
MRSGVMRNEVGRERLTSYIPPADNRSEPAADDESHLPLLFLVAEGEAIHKMLWCDKFRGGFSVKTGENAPLSLGKSCAIIAVTDEI